MLINSNISYKDVPLPYTAKIQAKCVCVGFGHAENVYIVSLYIKPVSRISKNEFVQFFNSIPKHCPIGGDFNAHHPAWGSEAEDTDGRNLLEAINSSNLIFLNNGEATLVTRPKQRKSAIDITLCSQNISHLFEWTVVQDPMGINHLPILLRSNAQGKTIKNKTNRIWNVRRADWSLTIVVISTTNQNIRKGIATTN